MNDDDDDDDGSDSLSGETRGRIVATLKHLVGLLVTRDYAGVERLTNGVRLSADWIDDGIDEYGHELVAPPEDAYSDLDVVPVEETSPPAYSVRFRLYTADEGASDLELRTTLIDVHDSALMVVEIDDLRVA